MPYVKIDLPPGVVRNGTKYESSNRWYLTSMIRWSQGAMQAVGGWSKLQDNQSTPANIDLTDPVRGLFGWKSNSQAAYLAAGTYNKAYGLSEGILTDITPADLTAGNEGASMLAGQYGAGTYGIGAYGEGAGTTDTVTEANSWQFDNFGQELIACAYSDGRILKWDLSPSNDLAVVDAQAPIGNRGVVVTPERFVVALGGKGQVSGSEQATTDGRRVIWSDRENYAQWNAGATGSQAGTFILPGGGQLMCGARMRAETLLWTDTDLFTMRYIGGVLVYNFQQIGSNCGIISRRAHAEVDGRAYWMGTRGFYTYDGYVKPLPCSISDAIFSDINEFEASRIAAWANGEFNEVWFTYPSGTSNECDRIVVYNYLENHWSGPWGIDGSDCPVRTDGIDRGTFGDPVAADSEGGLYFHERGTTMLDEDDATSLTPTAESGPFEIGQGDQLMTVRRYIPDENTAGDMDLTIKGSLHPTSSESDWGNYPVTVGSQSDVRFTARQIRLILEQSAAGWRFGIPKLEVIPRGRR